MYQLDNVFEISLLHKKFNNFFFDWRFKYAAEDSYVSIEFPWENFLKKIHRRRLYTTELPSSLILLNYSAE